MRAWGAALLALALTACGGRVVPPASGPAPGTRAPSYPAPGYAPDYPVRDTNRYGARTPTAATPMPAYPAPPARPDAVSAVQAGLVAGPAVAVLPITDQGAARALDAFRISCPTLMRRADATGMTRPGDWAAACDAAQRAPARDARAFFARHFEAVQVADGATFVTGYYEPEIAGSRDRRRGYDVPIYAKPSDLIEVDLGLFSETLAGKKIRGRVNGQAFVPYYDRTAIEEGALAGRGLEIGWAADPVEVFFLQVQGSGRLRLPDGTVMRVGYAGQNGHDYTSIGKLMKDRGLLAPGQASMQGMVAWLHAHPEQGRAIMRENESFVFFRELTGPGPLGALGLPVTPLGSVATDPRFVPLGAPVFLSMDRTDATGLWVAQDTGGAIKGANRFDTFWGAGEEARAIAGGMSAHGTSFVLVPLGTLARLRSGG